MGLLSDHGPQDWHPAPDAVKAAGRAAAELCRQRGVSLAALGMQFCVREPRIPTTISGAARAEEVEANVRAMEAPIDESLLRGVQAVFAPVQDMTWASGNWVDNRLNSASPPHVG
jgi:aryl-alcohol dehydrogenase-like predicted oxidoreductase